MNDLRGRGVLVTRPAGRAQGLARAVEAAGGVAVLAPMLEILSIPEKDRQLTWVNGRIMCSAQAVDLLVFVSPTAVEQAPRLLLDKLASLPVAAVGRATAMQLRERGCGEVIVPPDQADSEALAALPQLQVMAGQHVLIVRGEGGRAWLGDTLRQRGARVGYLECYRRRRPAVDLTELLARWRSGDIAAVTITSRQALDNLAALLPGDGPALLRATPLFASHARIAEHARVLGVQQVRVAGSGDAAMAAELQRFFATVARP